ncbi:DUF222 domain-containing protein [Salinibacterium sp. ZJ450]|uniref:DUF222 domain-containing protein n=1 Tax=Salinibacterium sp. ZJ450 TaxID=2708338 RepID=UPI00141D8ADA|nr:DUF222 domain-containing protein [Salinibacterium sp. ZJ450]
METLADQFDQLGAELSALVGPVGVRTLTDEELLILTGAVERLGRAVDGARVLAAGEIGDRSRRELGPDGLAYQKGCRNAIELLERVTLIGGLTANQRLKLGRQLHPDTTVSGEALPGRFPQVAEALTAGRIGIDAAAAIVKGLQPANAHRTSWPPPRPNWSPPPPEPTPPASTRTPTPMLTLRRIPTRMPPRWRRCPARPTRSPSRPPSGGP